MKTIIPTSPRDWMSEQASLGHDFTHKLSNYFWSSENDWIQKWLIYEIWSSKASIVISSGTGFLSWWNKWGKKEGAPILGLLFICSKRQRKGLVTKQTMPVFRGIV